MISDFEQNRNRTRTTEKFFIVNRCCLLVENGSLMTIDCYLKILSGSCQTIKNVQNSNQNSTTNTLSKNHVELLICLSPCYFW